jgi:cytochrome P450
MSEKGERKSDWDPWSPEAEADQWAMQAKMRRTCPFPYSDRQKGFWSITRYADIVTAAMDTASFKNGLQPRFALPSPPLESDPPEHQWYRKLLSPFFSAPRMKAIEGLMRKFAVGLLEPLTARGEGDLVRDFAFILPVRALCYLLNIPDEDWLQIKEWSEDAYSVFKDFPETRQRYESGNRGLYDYARKLLELRRREPLNVDEDPVTALSKAELNGKPLDDDTIVGTIRLLLSAGHESTSSSIGNCILYLAQNHEAQNRLRAEPSMIPRAVEEILRYDTPVMAMPRVVAKPVEVSGHAFQPGDYVYLVWSSGNRDETKFENPDQCIFERKPNPHLVFGYGIHACIGAPLARVELQVALEELLSRTRKFYISGPVTRTIFHRHAALSLPISFE